MKLMSPRIKISLGLIIASCSFSFGQIDQYNYSREVQGNPDQWNVISLPDEIFGKISQDLSDIRIYGITENNDTVEAPYLIRLSKETVSNNEVSYKTINYSHNNNGYYITFEIPTTETINHINLNFDQQNFDWHVQLAGSQNQLEWFTIIENYRILSIKNEWTDFQFSNLSFPNSNYRYFRLYIDSKVRPELTATRIAQYEITEGTLRNYPIQQIETKENKSEKQTEINIRLSQPEPVSYIKIGVKDSFDYYRPITIEYVTDSFKTEKGWKFNYQTLASGTLNSFEKNIFRFNSTTLQKLRILIDNHDNQPLTVDSIQTQGYVHELVTRITEPAKYVLCYGNKNARVPQYDIDWFTDKIPEKLKALELGEERVIEKEGTPGVKPLFENKTWLWIVMSVIIVLLGWFSINMIQKKNKTSNSE